MASTEPAGKGFRGVYYVNGRRHKTKTHPSKRKALDAANEQEVRARNGKWFDPAAGKVTFSVYFEHQWFPNRGGEQGTRDTYASIYNCTLKPRFGNIL